MAEGSAPECPVCLAAYTEDEENIPRILPCYHTTCESCIKTLIQCDTLKCPVCRVMHEAENEEQSFQQNKDVLAHIRSIGEKRIANGKCNDHGEDLDYYCFKGEKRIPICVVCKHTTHKGHDFKGIKETKQQEQKNVLKKLDNIILNIEENVKRMPRYMDIADKHFQKFMRSLDDVQKQLANKKEEVMAVRKESRQNDEMKLLRMRSQLALLRNTREAVQREDCTEHEMNIEALVGKDLCDWRMFSLFNVDERSAAEMAKNFSECMNFEHIPIALRHWEDGMNSQSLPKLTGIFAFSFLSILYIALKSRKKITSKPTKSVKFHKYLLRVFTSCARKSNYELFIICFLTFMFINHYTLLLVKAIINVECRNQLKMFNQNSSADVINVHNSSFLFTTVNHNSYVNCTPLVAVKIGRRSALASYDRWDMTTSRLRFCTILCISNHTYFRLMWDDARSQNCCKLSPTYLTLWASLGSIGSSHQVKWSANDRNRSPQLMTVQAASVLKAPHSTL